MALSVFGTDKITLQTLWGVGLALCLIALSCPALAASFYWGQHPDKDRLVFRFNSWIPEYSLERTGPKRLVLTCEDGAPPLPPQADRPEFSGSRFIEEVLRRDGSLLITTATRTFGFVHFTLPAENKLVVDFFADAHGQEWPDSPSNLTDGTDPEPQKRPPEGNPTQAAEPEASQPQAQPQEETTASQEAAAADPPASNPNPKGASSESPAPPSLGEPGSKPDKPAQTSQSHVLRAKISPVGPLQAAPIADRPGLMSRKKAAETTARAEAGPRPTSQNATAGPADTESKASSIKLARAGNASQGAGSSPADQALAQNASRSPNPQSLLSLGRKALQNEQFARSSRILTKLVQMDDVPEAIMEEALHRRAESLYRLYQGSFKAHYDELIGAFEEAINFNPNGSEVPTALYRLFAINLKSGNIPEARGYLNVLASEHPDHGLVPTASLQLGEHHLKEAQYDQALEHFRSIIDRWPKSPESRQAHFGRIRAYSEMEFYDKAWEEVEAVEKHWPQFHKRNPEFLNVAGFVALQTDRLEPAKRYFWRYYNVRPDSPEADFVLTRLGDIYLRQGHEGEATVMYHKAISRFPGQEGALVAKMRLAEEGIYDNPRLKDMPSYSEDSSGYSPREVYTEILSKHPDSPLAPLAQLKLAMWYLWKDRPNETLEQVERFEQTYPASGLLERARRVGRKALSLLIQEAVRNQEHAKILSLWREYDFLHASLEQVDPQTQLSVAMAMWKMEQGDAALKLASRFLTADSPDEHFATALKLSLNIHLSRQGWPKILDLSRKADDAKLPEDLRAQLHYAEALAYENLDRPEEGAPLWKELATNQNLSGQQRAFAYYFLARSSLRNDQLEAVYIQAQNALSILLREDTAQNQEKILDCLDMLIQVTERSGRLLEALEWAKKYEDQITADSEAWPAHRYRLAEIYRRAGDMNTWKQILESLAKKFPNSHFGQMAASDIAARAIHRKADTLLRR